MNSIIDYINSLPVKPETKWVAAAVAGANQKIFRAEDISRQTGIQRSAIYPHLNRLKDCGVLASREHDRGLHYWICDYRLIAHMAAARQNVGNSH